MLLYFITSLLFILLAASLAVWQLDRTHRRENEANARIIDKLIHDQHATLDRFFMSKGHLPSGIDVQKQAEERLAIQKALTPSKSDLPKAMNPVDKARYEAIGKEAETLK